jgi:hypothetical protein
MPAPLNSGAPPTSMSTPVKVASTRSPVAPSTEGVQETVTNGRRKNKRMRPNPAGLSRRFSNVR